jgi:hypothetical protein
VKAAAATCNEFTEFNIWAEAADDSAPYDQAKSQTPRSSDLARWNPENRKSGTETRNLKPEVQNLKPETRNLKPENRKSKPETQNQATPGSLKSRARTTATVSWFVEHDWSFFGEVHQNPYALSPRPTPTPSTPLLNSTAQTLHSLPTPLDQTPKPNNLNPKPKTPNPKPHTPHPEPPNSKPDNRNLTPETQTIQQAQESADLSPLLDEILARPGSALNHHPSTLNPAP